MRINSTNKLYLTYLLFLKIYNMIANDPIYEKVIIDRIESSIIPLYIGKTKDGKNIRIWRSYER